MPALIETLRGTAGSVLGATAHIAWLLDYELNGHRATRTVR